MGLLNNLVVFKQRLFENQGFQTGLIYFRVVNSEAVLIFRNRPMTSPHYEHWAKMYYDCQGSGSKV
jgi:hypothetical protein